MSRNLSLEVFGLTGWAIGTAIAAVFFSVAIAAKPSATLDADEARHLLNRTGFAASQLEVGEFTGLTRIQAANRLLEAGRTVAVSPPPAWVNEPSIPITQYRELTDEARQAEVKLNIERAFELREWWFREMLNTPSPLTEKMTLFWHNHFATSQQKVRQTGLMYQQHVLLRKHALGNFGVLLHQIARDPAMLIYLDSASNRKGQANENFAREVMELFTLGEGNYSEEDIKQVARAFTGWSLDMETAQYKFRWFIHDDGEKTIFGQKAKFNGDQALDLLLARKETAEFITRKLWREFVSPTPDDGAVTRMAGLFRASGYEITKLMQAMLTSDAFYALENRGSLIKSPVEFVVGTLKQFEISPPNMRPFVMTAALLGQNVFAPPNVKGWPGGERWINSASLLGRKQFIENLFKHRSRVEAGMSAMIDMADRGASTQSAGRAQRQQRAAEKMMTPLEMPLTRWARSYENAGGRDAALTGSAGMAKLVLAVSPPELPIGTDAADWARALATEPAYQLK